MSKTTIHQWTGPTGVHFREVKQPSGTYYKDTTPPEVIRALEQAYDEDCRIRIFLGDSKTGRDWLEENDVTGTVGRSTGPIKIPLLIRTNRSTGGGALLTDCIVRLLVNGREVYRHPKYSIPLFSVFQEKPRQYKDVPWGVYLDKEKSPHARFKTEQAARRWVAFMRGERLSK